jgi:hypothetical protein
MGLKAFDCEYRQNGDVWTLHIGGRPTEAKITCVPIGDESIEIEGAGVIKVKSASVWLSETGGDKANVQTYDSLEAALREEKKWLERIFYDGGGIEALAAATGLRPPDSLLPPKPQPPPKAAPLWTGYRVDAFLKPLACGICGTFINECEKDTRLDVDMGVLCWFTVSKDACENNGIFNVGVRGKLGHIKFKFNGGKDGYVFAAENSVDLRHDFYLFISMVQSYRSQKGLPLLDMDYITNIAKKDSPPLTAVNYAAFNGAYLSGITDYLERTFRGLAYCALHSKYAFTIYCENGAERNLPPECVHICQKYLGDFERLYSVYNAMLFCVRDNGKQYVYFYVKKKGLFYNTEDESRAFLTRNIRYLAEALSITPEDIVKQ